MKNNNISLISLGLPKHSRRQFLRKAIYASPVLLTLPATPSFAQQGSGGGAGDPGDTGDTGDPGDTGGGAECMPSAPPGDGPIEICHFGPQPINLLGSQDIVVDESELADHLLHGDAFGTCNAFFCGAS